MMESAMHLCQAGLALLLLLPCCSASSQGNITYCQAGHYLKRGHSNEMDHCLPCKAGTFQDKTQHRDDHCHKCHVLNRLDPRISRLVDECTRFHDIIFECIPGFIFYPGQDGEEPHCHARPASADKLERETASTNHDTGVTKRGDGEAPAVNNNNDNSNNDNDNNTNNGMNCPILCTPGPLSILQLPEQVDGNGNPLKTEDGGNHDCGLGGVLLAITVTAPVCFAIGFLFRERIHRFVESGQDGWNWFCRSILFLAESLFRYMYVPVPQQHTERRA